MATRYGGDEKFDSLTVKTVVSHFVSNENNSFFISKFKILIKIHFILHIDSPNILIPFLLYLLISTQSICLLL